jgi:pimeloyl-ACP methyl ester carboxylesterase
VRVPVRPLPGRLPANAVFPAGRPAHAVRWLTLPGGERVRAVTCEPAAGADPARPAVVCVHGWGCLAYSFRDVLRPLADAGLRAAAPDLRGHGWSDKPLRAADYTPAALASWLAAVLDALGVERAVLVGHSLGGQVVLEAALAAPERVAGLVLAAPLGFSTIARLRALRLATPDVLAPLLPYLATRATVRVGLVTSFAPGHRPTEREVDEYWAPTADPDLARAVRLIAHASDWAPGPPERLARVGCPTEVLLGVHDNLIDPEAVRPLARALPRGTLDVLAGVGHAIPDEAPERVVAAVAAVEAAAAAQPPAAGVPAARVPAGGMPAGGAATVR